MFDIISYLLPFILYFMGEVSALIMMSLSNVVHYPSTLSGCSDNVCLDGTVYILPFP